MPEATLHRCRTPTDRLCPCGRVARALRDAGVDYDEVRHPWRRRDREEVVEVSGQAVVPVLEWADGEAICDSLRIVEHLQWRSRDRQTTSAGEVGPDEVPTA